MRDPLVTCGDKILMRKSISSLEFLKTDLTHGD